MPSFVCVLEERLAPPDYFGDKGQVQFVPLDVTFGLCSDLHYLSSVSTSMVEDLVMFLNFLHLFNKAKLSLFFHSRSPLTNTYTSFRQRGLNQLLNTVHPRFLTMSNIWWLCRVHLWFHPTKQSNKEKRNDNTEFSRNRSYGFSSSLTHFFWYWLKQVSLCSILSQTQAGKQGAAVSTM